MKRYFLTLLTIATALSFHAVAQDQKSKRPSPPATAEGTINGTKIKIDYSAPSARGRKMLGGKEAYGEVWRTGANEATTIEFDKAVKIEGKDLAAGKYELFTIPGENKWTIIFQNYKKQWGHYSYKQANDALRVTVVPTATSAFVETFNISVGSDSVLLTWENTAVSFKVN